MLPSILRPPKSRRLNQYIDSLPEVTGDPKYLALASSCVFKGFFRHRKNSPPTIAHELSYDQSSALQGWNSLAYPLCHLSRRTKGTEYLVDIYSDHSLWRAALQVTFLLSVCGVSCHPRPSFLQATFIPVVWCAACFFFVQVPGLADRL